MSSNLLFERQDETELPPIGVRFKAALKKAAEQFPRRIYEAE